MQCQVKISIHALLAESDRIDFFFGSCIIISIHALLAESDLGRGEVVRRMLNFYPRSPCGERRLPTALRTPHHKFLSTLSLRRATNKKSDHLQPTSISIHALLAESDRLRALKSRLCVISIHALLAESDLGRGEVV